MRIPRPFIIGTVMATAALRAFAHDGPGDVIHLLTDRIEAQGPTARLLASRAYEHRSLRNLDAAIADFEYALKLQPGYVPAILGCAEAMLEQGAYSKAESMVRGGLVFSAGVENRAPLEAMLARTLSAQLRWSDALEAWRAALHSPSSEVDWFLGEAECLTHIGSASERVDALAGAMKRNPSVVLQRAWIYALVDAGDIDRASVEIEAALARSRWQSTWLLLRARISRQRGSEADERNDATQALAEIRSRIDLERPAPYLMAEMGNALALLGEREEARVCLERARSLGVPESLLVVETGG